MILTKRIRLYAIKYSDSGLSAKHKVKLEIVLEFMSVHRLADAQSFLPRGTVV